MFDLEQISSKNKFQHLHFHCEHNEGQNRLEPAWPRVGTSLEGRGGQYMNQLQGKGRSSLKS